MKRTAYAAAATETHEDLPISATTPVECRREARVVREVVVWCGVEVVLLMQRLFYLV